MKLNELNREYIIDGMVGTAVLEHEMTENEDPDSPDFDTDPDYTMSEASKADCAKCVDELIAAVGDLEFDPFTVENLIADSIPLMLKIADRLGSDLWHEMAGNGIGFADGHWHELGEPLQDAAKALDWRVSMMGLNVDNELYLEAYSASQRAADFQAMMARYTN